MRDPIAYTYEADHHCEDCAAARFGRDEHGDITGTDSEGNEVGAVFETDEWYNVGAGTQTLVCGDCGAELDEYEETPTLAEKAAEASGFFETASRGDAGGDGPDTYVRLKDGAPEWVADIVREAHGDLRRRHAMEAIETFDVHGVTVSIYPDDSAESPREWCNLSTMVAMPRLAREYGFCDRESTGTEDDAMSRGGMALLARYLRLTEGAEVQPFTFQDYGSSGARLFAVGIDSDRTEGFFYVTRDEIVAEYGDDSEASRALARSCMTGECTVMGQWVEGDVYGYVATGPNEYEDSCWGFFGYDDAKQQATAAAEWVAHQAAANEEPDIETAAYEATH